MPVIEVQVAKDKTINFQAYVFDTGQYIRHGKWEANSWTRYGDSKFFTETFTGTQHAEFNNARKKLNPDDVKKQQDEQAKKDKDAADAKAAADKTQADAKAASDKAAADKAAADKKAADDKAAADKKKKKPAGDEEEPEEGEEEEEPEEEEEGEEEEEPEEEEPEGKFVASDSLTLDHVPSCLRSLGPT